MEPKGRIPGWRKSVYRQGEMLPDDWIRLRRAIQVRDQKCQACWSRHELTVHHIVPRKMGGKSDPGNLVALCVKCHDEVEHKGICTFQRFYDWLESHPRIGEEEEIARKPPAPDKDWRKWVYGGYKSPQVQS